MNNDCVKDWMTPCRVTIPSICTLVEAYQLMMVHKMNRLPVVDQGELVGIVTLENLRRKLPDSLGFFSANPGSLYDDWIPVSHVMSRNPQTVQSDASLTQAAHLLLNTQTPALPVMEGDQVVGIITERDILRALLLEVKV